ncbi:Hsp70/Hsp90 co-chaperone-like protein [Hapsidospora chrysogenum ATCC 11550]|uniref:Hsp70/Hsp90 co-chaperone-like protein n=1 Tax=Hapsidospora chrysogenum (strain ATCC 11550 / CBS 779.69 / DSM 880 / IAM 14645 / JCM 23072 / IMI 49137) TaxID=857340 RepID=A0A086TEL0_HAPC1|nr:Hsp70/Hsp90 co-chaperone-like protein [Hapsidospora chrysogenum ATCC 11550]
MSIEELTEQMAKAMEAAEASGQNADATKPSLPPGHALQAGKTVDEVLADLNKSPLFMTELEENDDIAALQALNYEGTPLENGTDFKERGNECFRARMFADAKEFYTKGVQILAAEERKRQNGEVTKNPEGEPDSEEEIAKQRGVLEGLYVNRAACHLELRNYRSCWTDCAAALRLNPANVKACYRSARALLAVGRIEEADDVCARGLALDGENKALRGLADEIISKAKERDARRRKEAEREAREKRRALLRKAALKARGIPTRTTEKPPEMEDAALALVPDPDDPRSTLSFPTVLLYPAHLETDFIKGFNEMQTLEDHLSYVFPLPWDKEGTYTMAGTECYVETREGGLLKMGKRVPLLKILSTGKVEVVDEVVRIFVLPKAEAEAWVKKFKEQKAAVRGKSS